MDIFFMSYRESNAEINWQRTLEFHPNAIRLHGIRGIDKIHLLCNQLSSTEYFWTIDGDNYLIKHLDFDYDEIFTDLVMFHAIDVIQEKPTLLGGLKLWKTNKIINQNMSKGDFTLNATSNKQVIDKIFSITVYNSSAFDAWKTAFRHCVKCMTVIFRSRPNAKNLDTYIQQWKSCIKYTNKLNAIYAYKGYLDALEYSKIYDNNLEELYKINDYDWLLNYFRNKHE